jgi:hypothetical protein
MIRIDAAGIQAQFCAEIPTRFVQRAAAREHDAGACL